MNFGHWMDGAWGIPAWLWLVAIAVGSVLMIFWLVALMADSAHREKVERRRLYYLTEELDRVYPKKDWEET